MNYEIVEIREGTWRIEDGGVRFFLLAGREKALLIDSGMNVHNAREIAEGLTELPLELLNTHADRDHIGSNAEFERFYMHPDEEPLCRRNGLKGELLPLREGDRLELGDRSLRIFHLPGHTPGSIAVLDEKNRVLISGDPIQRHGRIYLFGGHRDLWAYVRSLALPRGAAPGALDPPAAAGGSAGRVGREASRDAPGAPRLPDRGPRPGLLHPAL